MKKCITIMVVGIILFNLSLRGMREEDKEIKAQLIKLSSLKTPVPSLTILALEQTIRNFVSGKYGDKDPFAKFPRDIDFQGYANYLRDVIKVQCMSEKTLSESMFNKIDLPSQKEQELMLLRPSDKLKIINSKTSTTLRSFKPARNFINSARISPDGKRIALHTMDNNIQIIDTQAYGVLIIATLGDSSYRVGQPTFSPTGNLLAAAAQKIPLNEDDFSATGSLLIWDTNNWALIKKIDLPNFIESFCFSSDGKILAIATFDEKIYILSTETWRVIAIYKGRIPIALATENTLFSQNTSIGSTQVQVVNPKNGTLIKRLSVKWPIKNLVTNRTGSLLFHIGEKTIYLYNGSPYDPSLKLISEYSLSNEIEGLSISFNSTEIWVSSDKIQLYFVPQEILTKINKLSFTQLVILRHNMRSHALAKTIDRALWNALDKKTPSFWDRWGEWIRGALLIGALSGAAFWYYNKHK